MQRLSAITIHISQKNKEGKCIEDELKNGQIDHRSDVKIDGEIMVSKDLTNAVRAATGDENKNVHLYDPGFANTAAAKSAITLVDGENGILTYRGYRIEELADKSTFLEVAYLLIYGELPAKADLEYFKTRVMRHTFIHSDLSRMMHSFRYNSHPMGMLISTLAAMSTVHPESNPALSGPLVYNDLRQRNKQIHRLIGNVPTIAAFSYRHRQGRPYVYPSHNNLEYTENFLFMLDRMSNSEYRPNKVLAKALDTMFILHADHELNCSTAVARNLFSSGVDVYSALAGATAALYGPKHGGANQAVLQMLSRIGSVENVGSFVQRVKQKKERLIGFGHRVYRNYDPRARIIKKIARDVSER